MKKILLFFTIFIPLMIAAETVVPPGQVSGQWRTMYSPYVVTGDIYIEDGATLEIDPGVEIYFKGWYKLEVFGSLIAEGSENKKITFVQYEGISLWRGIRFYETTANSILDHCIVQGAISEFGDTIAPEYSGGGILCYNSPDAVIMITNSLIRDNRAAYGGGIMCWNSSLILDKCEIIDNSARRGGGIVLYDNAVANISNTKFFGNHATFDGGGIAIVDCWDISIQKNQFAFNSAANGAGLHLNKSNGIFCANTIAENAAAQDGGGIYLSSASSPDLTNCLLYSNTDGTDNGGGQVYLMSSNCDPDFYHCNIYMGKIGFEGQGAGSYFNGVYEHCVDGDPCFNDAASGDFSITWANYPYDDYTKSACIDNGCPMQGPDPDNSCCDIGVFHYFQILDKPEELYGDPVSCTTFVASWNSCYGALGYLVDVAYDHGFNNFILEGEEVREPMTELEVTIPQITESVYFRVRSYNTGLTSEYSEEHSVAWVSVDEPEDNAVEIFSSATGIHINTTRTSTDPGEVRIYNLSGQLLGHYSMRPGNMTIDPGFANQVVIITVYLDGKVYQQKLLLH